MKFIKYFLVCAIFIGCDKDNPISSGNLDYQIYMGLPNTTREYETVEWMYEANSEIPYIKVPDSLLNKLSFDSSQLQSGIASINRYREVIIPKDTSYNKLKYYDPYSVYCQQKTITIEHRNLETELEYALKGIPYYGSSSGESTDGTTFVENVNEYSAQYDDTSKYCYLKKPLSLNMEWVRKQWQYKAENGNFETIKIMAKVIGKENISIKAGNYSAYKIEETNYWVDLDYKMVSHYEYYVPNVGLILFEQNLNLYRTTLSSDGSSKTIFFKQIIRKELVNVNFVNN